MQTQVELLEQQLSDAKTLIATRQMALRLKQYPDFKKLIRISSKVQVEHESEWFGKFKEIMQG